MGLKNLGSPMQNAFIVEDLDAAIEHWAKKMGVGPFVVYRNHEYKSIVYQKNAGGIEASLAFAYCGDFQIELIQVHNKSLPSVFTESELGSEPKAGLHHMGFISTDFENDLKALHKQGLTVIQRNIDNADVETAFLNSEFHPGGLIEVLNGTPQLIENLELLKLVASQWDGKDAILNL